MQKFSVIYFMLNGDRVRCEVEDDTLTDVMERIGKFMNNRYKTITVGDSTKKTIINKRQINFVDIVPLTETTVLDVSIRSDWKHNL